MVWNPGSYARTGRGRYSNRHERRASRQLRRDIGLGTWRPFAWLGPTLAVCQVLVEWAWKWLATPVRTERVVITGLLTAALVVGVVLLFMPLR